MFTKDDVDKIFKYNNTKSAFKKIERLLADNLIERIAEGDEAGKYLKKTKSIA